MVNEAFTSGLCATENLSELNLILIMLIMILVKTVMKTIEAGGHGTK